MYKTIKVCIFIMHVFIYYMIYNILYMYINILLCFSAICFTFINWVFLGSCLNISVFAFSVSNSLCF